MQVLTEKITALLDAKFAEPEFAECFLVDMTIAANKQLVEIFLDSDTGISFATCQKISRYLEAIFDENGWLGQDYVLEVSSPGATRPLMFARQYPKHLERDLIVTLADRTVAGMLAEVTPEHITLEYETKHKEGKKTIRTEHREVIAIADIKSAVVELVF